MKGLDALDKKILFALDGDARQSMSQLARQLKQGRDRVEYRVDRLIQLGVITGFTTFINLAKLGLSVHKIYLRLANDKRRAQEFYAHLRSHPGVYRVAFYDGAWDLNIAMPARSPRDFYETHSVLLSKFHDIVLDYAMYTLVDVWNFQRSFFTGKTGSSGLLGGPADPVRIDQLEYEILKALADNGRVGVSELSDKLRSTPTIVSNRIERLQRTGIIAAHRLKIDLSVLGMLYFKTQIFLRNSILKERERFFTYCAEHPNVTFFVRQLGECSIEIELEVQDLAQYHSIIADLRERFASLIQNFRSMLISQEYFKFIPSDLVIDPA